MLSSARYRFSRFELDLIRGCLREGEQDVKLRPKAFALLRLLVEQAGRLLSKDELMAAVWPGVFVSDESLVQCVREIRRALGDGEQGCIKTVPGRGYLFAVPVAIVEPAPAVPALPTADVPRRATTRSRPFLGLCALVVLGGAAAFGVLATQLIEGAPPAAPPSLLSVAVLPFEWLGERDGSDDPAAAMTDDLRVELSRLPGGLVIARQTSQNYKQPGDVTAIGRALNVRFALEGSIRREAGQLRIAAKIDDTATGLQIWAQMFEGDASDRARSWDDLVGRIGTSALRALMIAAAERSWQEHRDAPTALDFEIRGRALMRKGLNRENFIAARAQFEAALRLDPTSVEAMRRVAQTGIAIINNDWADDREAELARVDSLNQKTLALNPNHAMAQFTRAALLHANGHLEQAIAAYQRAIELDPRYMSAYAGIGRAMIELGRFEAALRHLEMALHIGPNDGDSGAWYFLIGVAQLYLGRDEAAVLSLRKAIEINPERPTRRKWFVVACGLTGRLAEAERELTLIRAQESDFSEAQFMQITLANAEASADQREHLREGLRRAGVSQ